MPLQHVDRIVQPTEIEVCVREVEQDRTTKCNRTGREGEAFGAEQGTMCVSDVAARLQDVRGFEHRGAHDRERRVRRLGRLFRQCDLPGGCRDGAAAIVEKAQVLSRDHFAFGLTHATERRGRLLVVAHRLRFVVVQRCVAEDQCRPRASVVTGAQLSKMFSCLRQAPVLCTRLIDAQQLGVPTTARPPRCTP